MLPVWGRSFGGSVVATTEVDGMVSASIVVVVGGSTTVVVTMLVIVVG